MQEIDLNFVKVRRQEAINRRNMENTYLLHCLSTKAYISVFREFEETCREEALKFVNFKIFN